MYSLRLSTRWHGCEATVSASGELDIATIEQFREHVETVLTSRRLNVLRLNVSGLSFFGFAGLGTLVGLQQRARQQHTALHLTEATEELRRLLKVTRLDGHFILE